jgi:hypothetical protein
VGHSSWVSSLDRGCISWYEEEMDEIIEVVTRSSRVRTAKDGWRLRGCVVGVWELQVVREGDKVL